MHIEDYTIGNKCITIEAVNDSLEPVDFHFSKEEFEAWADEQQKRDFYECFYDGDDMIEEMGEYDWDQYYDDNRFFGDLKEFFEFKLSENQKLLRHAI